METYDSLVRGPASVAEPLEITRSKALRGLDARLELPSGRSIECQDSAAGGELVTIRGAGGVVELEVRLTDRGPVLCFEAAELELKAAGRIRAECDRFEVAARGDILQQAGGTLTTRAHTTDMLSTRGDVRIRANDDVKLNGERVKLNC